MTLMIRRVFNLVLLVAMIVGAAVTYDMKHKAELAAERNARLEAAIAKDKDSIALLRAEWALLTQPSRLQELVDKYADHFKLQTFSPTQIATIDEIPMRPPVAAVAATSGAADPIGGLAARAGKE
jgi:hypothetical protein